MIVHYTLYQVVVRTVCHTRVSICRRRPVWCNFFGEFYTFCIKISRCWRAGSEPAGSEVGVRTGLPILGVSFYLQDRMLWIWQQYAVSEWDQRCMHVRGHLNLASARHASRAGGGERIIGSELTPRVAAWFPTGRTQKIECNVVFIQHSERSGWNTS